MFCDKTGTLTENKMVFKRCALQGQDFNHNSYSNAVTGSSVIPVNPRLAEHLNNLDIQVCPLTFTFSVAKATLEIASSVRLFDHLLVTLYHQSTLIIK